MPASTEKEVEKNSYYTGYFNGWAKPSSIKNVTVLWEFSQTGGGSIFGGFIFKTDDSGILSATANIDLHMTKIS